jgi:rod shape-determining protein MreD
VVTISGLVILGLQVSVFPVLVAPPFRPDLLLILVVYIALRGTVDVGAPLVWLIGLGKDLFSGLYLGANAASFLIVYLVIKQISDRLYAESGSVFVVAVTISTLLASVINLFLLVTLSPVHGIASAFGLNLIPHLLVNAFCASLVALLPDGASSQAVQ